jgi:hypothetical protein
MVVPITADSNCKAFVPQRAGLCATCAHARTVVSSKQSTFVRCALADSDPAFARYPSLPVVACAGYTRDDGQRSSGGA